MLHRLIEDDEDIAITGIILTEILQGVKDDREYHAIKERLLMFPCIEPKGPDTYFHSARIYRACRDQGKTVRKTVDLIIAAICLENNLILLHRDRDFEHIADCTGLKIIK